ncbi:hypothetical protein EST35_0440 [Pseudomonas phage vB_PaeM_PA5oct]|uniref:Uncharacterized protein n=1 Tax=Pseudomonas phage vB_PaeM_PA5oct TaxID=2163605 RepID=A0A4Y5JUF4_9CAUD|nr:hypothetical protein PQE65_gp057 [Pseudomonas phage vB_PaeM_PA5oct]QCG76308.1 hypothetical protein EST35_0440 [Pseudomonas phage vB_PaeM_PA5oct]
MNIHILQYDMSDSSILCNITRYSYTIRLSNYTSFHFVISGMGRPITKVVSSILCTPIHIIDVCNVSHRARDTIFSYNDTQLRSSLHLFSISFWKLKAYTMINVSYII